MMQVEKNVAGDDFKVVMRALIAKDLRFFRVPMLGLIAVGAACYVIGIVFTLINYPGRRSLVVYAGSVGGHLRQHAEYALPSLSNELLETIHDSSVAALAFVALLASVFGGIAIASERSDRTADFVALLPVSRFQNILSKWLASVLLVGGFFVLYSLIALGTWIARNRSGSFFTFAAEWGPAVVNWMGCTLCFFGVAWLLSTFLKSGPISACVSIGVTLCVVVLTVSMMDGHSHRGDEVAIFLACIAGAIGFCSISAGTIYYLRRVAP